MKNYKVDSIYPATLIFYFPIELSENECVEKINRQFPGLEGVASVVWFSSNHRTKELTVEVHNKFKVWRWLVDVD